MAKPIIGEATDILRNAPSEQLSVFVEIRNNEKMWDALRAFVRDQKMIKQDQIYRLRRPKDINDIIKNTVDHEYYASRIAGNVVLLQVIENASDELERRERALKTQKK